jgi:ribonuclease HII
MDSKVLSAARREVLSRSILDKALGVAIAFACAREIDAFNIRGVAASIVAKVARDALMIRMDAHYPEYGFASHVGYGTRAHVEALARWGPSPLHRRSFHPKALDADRD